MGKFISTEYTNTINSLIDGFKERYRTNPFYMWSDKSNTIVDYYHTCDEKSTLDEGLKTVYSQLGDMSPIRYNVIRDFYLYGGFERIELMLENGEFGLETDDITSSTIVLPNTIIPVQGDQFSITYLENKYLFEVTTVNVDTLENGANFYKIDFEFKNKNDSNIIDLIETEYEFILDNANNTKLKSIIRSDDYKYCVGIEKVLSRLKEYYKNLFYNTRVQTFTYNYMGANFYDANVIEFLIRNRLMAGEDRDVFVYLNHAVDIPATFILDYDKSIFRAFEMKDARLLKRNWGSGEFIEQPLSLLGMQKESYFFMNHHISNPSNPSQFQLFSDQFISNIKTNTLFNVNIVDVDEPPVDNGDASNEILRQFDGSVYIPQQMANSIFPGSFTIVDDGSSYKIYPASMDIPLFNSMNTYLGSIKTGITANMNYDGLISIDAKEYESLCALYNVLIKYFNNTDLSKDDIENIQNIDYSNSIFLFYTLPLLIYVLDKSVENKLALT